MDVFAIACVIFSITGFLLLQRYADTRSQTWPLLIAGNTKLPGNATTSAAVDFPDEQTIGIDSSGQVLLNDAPIDAPNDSDLPTLTDTLKRLKQNAENAKTTLLVTIASEPKAPYFRTIDVLNALAAAAIDNVTFTVDDGL